MIIDDDPKNPSSSGGGDENGGNDFPDIPTNDRGQLTTPNISPSDYPDMNTNDWAQRSIFPDIGASSDSFDKV